MISRSGLLLEMMPTDISRRHDSECVTVTTMEDEEIHFSSVLKRKQMFEDLFPWVAAVWISHCWMKSMVL